MIKHLIILTETSFCHFTFHCDYRNMQASKSFEEGNKIYKTDLDLRYLKKEIEQKICPKQCSICLSYAGRVRKRVFLTTYLISADSFSRKDLKKGKTWFIEGDFWIIFNLTVSNIYFAIFIPHAKNSLALFQPFCKQL